MQDLPDRPSDFQFATHSAPLPVQRHHLACASAMFEEVGFEVSTPHVPSVPLQVLVMHTHGNLFHNHEETGTSVHSEAIVSQSYCLWHLDVPSLVALQQMPSLLLGHPHSHFFTEPITSSY